MKASRREADLEQQGPALDGAYPPDLFKHATIDALADYSAALKQVFGSSSGGKSAAEMRTCYRDALLLTVKFMRQADPVFDFDESAGKFGELAAMMEDLGKGTIHPTLMAVENPSRRYDRSDVKLIQAGVAAGLSMFIELGDKQDAAINRIAKKHPALERAKRTKNCDLHSSIKNWRRRFRDALAAYDRGEAVEPPEAGYVRAIKVFRAMRNDPRGTEDKLRNCAWAEIKTAADGAARLIGNPEPNTVA